MTIDELIVKARARIGPLIAGGVINWADIQADLDALVRTETERCLEILRMEKEKACHSGDSPLTWSLRKCVDEILYADTPKPKPPPEPGVQDELLAACKICVTVMTSMIDPGCTPHLPTVGSPEFLVFPLPYQNLRAARHLARRAIERAEKEKA